MLCHYCWQRQGNKNGEYIPTAFIDSEMWIEALNRIGFEIIDISGGEPFLQPGIIEILKRVKGKIGITSNLTMPMAEFVSEVSPDKVVSITASYHPSQTLGFDQFIGRVLLLKAKGFNITVNFVGHPDQMYLIPALKKNIDGLGVRFHVDPYVPYLKPYPFSDQEKEFLSKFVGSDREHYLKEAKISTKKCSAGKTHLHIQPNGDAYRCYTDFVQKKPKIGNIFEKSFRGSSGDGDCSIWSKCLGCDKDKVEIYDK